jgi:hypothetical protein
MSARRLGVVSYVLAYIAKRYYEQDPGERDMYRHPTLLVHGLIPLI